MTNEDLWVECVIGLYQYKYNPYVFSNSIDGKNPFRVFGFKNEDGTFTDYFCKDDKVYGLSPLNIDNTPEVIIEDNELPYYTLSFYNLVDYPSI